MAVAVNQIGELINVISRHVRRSTLKLILLDMKDTRAYSSNFSFKSTVDRMIIITENAIKADETEAAWQAAGFPPLKTP